MNVVKSISLLLATLFLCILILSGCASMNPAASIRVEVDVYKGPLSKPIIIQKEELAGIIVETIWATEGYLGVLKTFLSEFGCKTCCQDSQPPNNDLIWRNLCSYHDQTLALNGRLRKIFPPNDDGKIEWPDSDNMLTLKKAARIAAEMKTQSATAAAAFIPMNSDSERLRVAQAMFSTMTSEYGNLIGSRANALMIQLHGYGGEDKEQPIPRRNLHLNMYLADSSTTKAPRLYEWYDAKAPFLLEEWNYSIPGYNTSMTDRIRIYETLFNDTYWSNVNTVYASGTGEVGMALIRDDIGNWNLKNFDNDPAELLTAYKDIMLAGINATTKLINSAASGGSVEALQAALSMADQLTTPLDATSPSTIPIAEWHQRVVDQIGRIKKQSGSEWTKNSCNETPGEMVTAKSPREPPAEILTAEQLNEASEDSVCKNIIKDTREQIKRILRDHSVALDAAAALQEVDIPPQSKGSVPLGVVKQ